MIMFTIKVVFMCVFLLCFTNIEGKANGYRYYSNLQAKLKLHRDPADFQTARIKCHDEDAILAAPWSEDFWSLLLEEVLSPNSGEDLPLAIYAGVQEYFPEGIYKNKNGKQVLSRDWQDTIGLARCVIYNSNGTRELVNCQLPFAYVCHAPAALEYVTLECGGSDYELNSETGSCYKFHKDCKPWDEAYTTCQDEGAHLVIINSDKEAKALVDMFAKYPSKVLNTKTDWEIAVGFYYWKEANTYITIEGRTIEEAGYARWESSNPSRRGYSPYGGAMFRNGLLDDVDKSVKIPFVCEKKPIQLTNNNIVRY